MIFRGSIPHPVQSLCTLRNHCRQWPRNTRYQADATPYLGRTFTGWIAPALCWRTYSITSSVSASHHSVRLSEARVLNVGAGIEAIARFVPESSKATEVDADQLTVALHHLARD